MKIEIDGLDKIKKDLENLQKDLEEHEEESVPLGELLNPEFMQSNTEFSDFDDMLESGEFQIDSEEDLEELLESDEWNDYVVDTTQFKNWEEMLQAAAYERITKTLGFNE